jgi:hypothetical protein
MFITNRKFATSDMHEMEFMPIVPLGEEELNDEEKEALPEDVPLIALRNTVLFPNVVLPITVAREKSVKAISDAQKANKWIAVVAQKDGNNEDPAPEDMLQYRHAGQDCEADQDAGRKHHRVHYGPYAFPDRILLPGRSLLHRPYTFPG